MSFGFGVGDFLAVGTLAWKVYRACKGLTEEFHEVAREALTVHTLMKELQDEANTDYSILNMQAVPKKKELLKMIDNLSQVLDQIDAIVDKFQRLGRRERRIWNQLRLSNEDLDKVRGKLTFHVNAINAFTASLSRSTLVRIETVLKELVREIHDGRRSPSIVSVDDTQDQSVWRELESELAEDGISKADVAPHKAAIKVFLFNLLSDTAAETMSLDEVASLVESKNDKEDWETLSRRIPGLNISSGSLSRTPTISSTDKASFMSDDSQQYQSAREELSEENLAIPHISFADSTSVSPSKTMTRGTGEIDNRLQQLALDAGGSRSIYSYRHSIDASAIGDKQDMLGVTVPLQPSNMVLIIDPFHTSVSKLAHAYMRSLTKTISIVREHVDTVRSKGWKVPARGGADTVMIDSLIKELLTHKRVMVPNWRAYNLFFRFQDVLEFDYIIYINSPDFGQYLEDNIQSIADLKAAQGNENKKLARLIKYDLPTSVKIPELMSSESSPVSELLRNRQKLAIDEIFTTVQRFMVDFLEREYGLKKTGQGFKKAVSRRSSRSSSLFRFDLDVEN